jgi:hypothetical protein
MTKVLVYAILYFIFLRSKCFIECFIFKCFELRDPVQKLYKTTGSDGFVYVLIFSVLKSTLSVNIFVAE